MLLRATTDILRVNIGTAADIRITRSVMIADGAAPPALAAIPDLGPLGAQTGTGNVTVVDTSGGTSGHNWKLLHNSYYNAHASAAPVLRVEHFDGSNAAIVANVTLLPGERLEYVEGGHWLHFDANGGIYPSIGNAATQAEMEAGSATDRYVTPQGFNWHPGALKAWGKANGAGTSLLVNHNISGITDTGTGRLGVTIGTDFSSANYAISCDVERTVTALTATGVEDCAIRNASPAAGSFEIESYDHTATTMAAQDPNNYFWLCAGDQ